MGFLVQSSVCLCREPRVLKSHGLQSFCIVSGLGFSWGLGFGVWGFGGLGVWGLGFGVWGLRGFRAETMFSP